MTGDASPPEVLRIALEPPPGYVQKVEPSGFAQPFPWLRLDAGLWRAGAPPLEADVWDMASWPLSAIGRLTIGTSDGTRTCTGSVVADGLILTAAHCVMRPESDAPEGAARWIRFSPQGEGKDFWVVEAAFIPVNWTRPSNNHPGSSDVALLLLDRPIAAQTGTLSVLLDFDFQQPIHSFGYSEALGENRLSSAGDPDHLPWEVEHLAIAPIDLTEGASGGPWVTAFDEGMAIVGLNSFKPAGRDALTASPKLSAYFEALETAAAAELQSH